jgi:hypothetical protein
VPARGNKRQGALGLGARRLPIKAEQRRYQMALQMIDRNQRNAPPPGEGSGETDSHEEGADKTGACSCGNHLDRAESPFECPTHEVWQRLEMFA